MKDKLNPLSNLYKPRPYANVINRDGRLELDETNAWLSYLRDPYHLMLTIPWLGFVILVTLIYILINVVFAIFYLFGGDCLTGARPGSFLDAFFFSVQTLASIGYGVISPKTLYANVIVTVEAITSLLAIAMLTGIAFARFTRPSARVLFSEVAVISPFNDIQTLMFRAANERRNRILEAQIKVDFSIDHVTTEGEFTRRFYELALLRHRTSSFNLAWTVRHIIDETSPLFGLSPDMMAEGHASIIVSLIGIDETVAYTINARKVYSFREIHWNYRFVDMFTKTDNGDRHLDYQHFHSISPVK